ncbi:MORC family CW-type zinc finger protein 3 isoform X2 [Melanotaenia boesemani]|uniref:MORC family CW-type zinc finger protein 3 isoform X2 n=1 Tax=Melanotaenia boesemani TaxID=1250792 RepID=UPI001C04B159|nr:MORC family CW-type zinc finger protein 3 isoform X2 [Melanotaenia boesemani]
MARLSEHGIRLSSMSPSFLNSNSTSHTWPFSAVAELIDNASDPGVSAKQIWIDVVNEEDQMCLTFTDNGSGMTPSKLHKMLSFGFTEKGSGKASLQAIGVYGNGFKSGSMRLGRDALIFTKNGGCQTVGMLSQTYLENIKAQAVIVPIVPFNQQTKSLVVTEDSEASLAAILQHSIIKSQEQIHAHFNSIPSKKGTKILIWNIRRAKDGNTEIDFETDDTDLRLPEIQIEELKKGLRNSGSLRPEQNIPDMHYSLRAYLSILYLKPRTQVILRGRKILAKLVAKRLTHIEHDVYKPQFSKEKVKVTFGLNPKRDHYGIMMYHKNRLIKAYEKVGCQLKTSGQRAGVGVIGIIECNFLKPAHNKQDFEYTKEYRLTLSALGLKLNDYWKEVTEKKAREREFQALDKDDNEDQPVSDKSPMWLQCEECLKWRSVPAGHYKVTPESWTCSQNPSPRYRSCSSPEEAEESEELLTPSYQKNHKKLEQSRSRKRENSLEGCQFQEEMAKHLILSRRSSEPSFQSTQTLEHATSVIKSHIKEKTIEHDETDTHNLTSHHADTHTNVDGNVNSATDPKEKPNKRDTVIKVKNKLVQTQAGVENIKRLEDKDGEIKINTCMETVEREMEHINTLSLKRKSESLYHCVKKKNYFGGEQSDSGIPIEDMHPEKQTDAFKNDSSNPVENSDSLQQTLTSRTRSHSLRATQTALASSLSGRDGPPGRMLPPEGDDREAKLLRLHALEREVQRLRNLLGQDVIRTSQGTMTTDDSDVAKPKQGKVISTEHTAEAGCQTDMAECSTSATNPAPAAGLLGLQVQGQRASCDPKDQSEQNRLRKEKTDSQSRTALSDSEACDNTRSAEQNLHDIRNNVVVLLTALLPQLDLTDISLETADVDNILQQIIDVNSLKL